MHKRDLALAGSAVLMGVLMTAGTVFAAGPGWGGFHFGMGRRADMRGNGGQARPALIGQVTAESGATLTVSGKSWAKGGAPTSYTVDGSSATFAKRGAGGQQTITASDIAVGDMVMVKGTVNGTSVAATSVTDLGAKPAWGHEGQGDDNGGRMQRPAVVGTVSAVNGTTITVSSKAKGGSTTSYTIDAAKATVVKDGKSVAASDIAVGDMVMVKGTVNGTSVAATSVMDGAPHAPTPVITGNGEPVIGGNVTAISGTTITVANNDVTYTVDAANAKVQKGRSAGTISDIVIGDHVVVQGTVNGTSVAATSVMDQTSAAKSGNGPAKGFAGAFGRFHGMTNGFFHAVSGFFQRVFGFL